MNKKAAAMIALLLAVLALAGCGKSSIPPTAEKAVRQVTEAASKIVESLPPELKGEIPACEAVFVGVEKQPYTDEAGRESMLNTVWLYFDDMTFEQYAFVDGAMQLFSTGTYDLSGEEGFLLKDGKTLARQLTLHRMQKYQAGKGLAEYDSTHTYDLNTLGFELYWK